MKRHYELTYIIRIDTSAEVMNEQVQQVQGWISEEGQGRILREEIWGRRKLAYHIEHQNEGFYIHYLTELETDMLPELQQNLKLAPDILRYLFVRVDDAEIGASEEAEAEETADEVETAGPPAGSPAVEAGGDDA